MNGTQMLRTVEVDTIDYVCAHGREPRGRGCWMFCTVDPRRNADYLNHMIQVTGTYTEARSQAVAVARERGVSRLYTCA